MNPTGVDLRDVHTPELVFALCGPIGSPLHDVAAKLKDLLERTYGYECAPSIRLSEFIDSLDPPPEAPVTPYERVTGLINRGNQLRETYGASILADLAIRQIAAGRETYKSETKAKSYAPRRVCHIIDSIKNTEELETLKLVYRDLLFTIGVFASLEARENRLKNSHMDMSEVYQLIDRDSGEEIGNGQTVRDIFPRSDYFLRTDGDSAALTESKLARFLSLLFALKVTTPTEGEMAMYHAATAARNSACLSRQVGAALIDGRGRLLSVGWNDVPKSGGGVYRSSAAGIDGQLSDRRCFNWKSRCESDCRRRDLARKIVDSIIEEAGIDNVDKEQLVGVVLKSKIGDLIEFSRSIHAELHAILSAHIQLNDATLYCTAYPCHYCAPHIIAAGIKEVRYIEPYRKSLAIQLHSDAMCEEENDLTRVRVLPYDGVAPSRYLELFEAKVDSRKDKNSGVALERAPSEAPPKGESTLEALPVLEALVIAKLQERNVPNIGEYKGELNG